MNNSKTFMDTCIHTIHYIINLYYIQKVIYLSNKKLIISLMTMCSSYLK